MIAQDVFPEIAVKLGRLRNPIVIGALGLLIDSSLRSADRVVAIGDTMKQRLEEKGVRPERIRVIPNWVDVTRVHPVARDNPWAREHRLTGRFVVMHAGNVGHAQDLDTLIRACTFLRDLDDLAVRIIGGGARREELTQLAGRLETDQVRFMSWQPYDRRERSSLSSADIHVVGLARGPRRLRRSQPPVRRARRRAAGDRRRRGGERDRPAGRAQSAAASSSGPATRSRSRRRSAPPTTASSISPRWDGARARSPSPRPTGRSRSRRYGDVIHELEAAS